MDFRTLRKNLKKDYSGFKTIKVAIIADWATQMLAQAVRGLGYEESINIEIYEGIYDQMEAEILDPTSQLYTFEPDYVVLFPCAEKYHSKYVGLTDIERVTSADSEAKRISTLCNSIARYSKAKVLLSNYCEINDGIYGNYAATYEESYLYSQRKLNNLISDIVREDKHIYLLDILALQNEYGRKKIFDERLYYLSKVVFGMEILPEVAKRVISIINVLSGKVKKCLIADLDNTLWGGIIGDDGIEGIQIGNIGIGNAFSDLQSWIKELSQRGVAIAICSKNNENIAKEPFEKHKEMVLGLNDISVFIANWEDKASNIKRIQEILNIGFDSMVFIDDNPFERELVRGVLPDVEVPDLPEDPTKYLRQLQEMNLFETINISGEDKKRTKLYREEAKRNVLKIASSNIDDYLMSLDMKADVNEFNEFSLPRVAQLSQRSNQFNLRTKRYSEQEIAQIIASPEKYITMTVELKDKFGEYGIICVVILEVITEKVLFLDTMLMSCRVLKRSVEEFVFNRIVEVAKANGFEVIVGEYLPTQKNNMVKELLGKYDFKIKEQTDFGDKWELIIKDYTSKKTFVEVDNE